MGKGWALFDWNRTGLLQIEKIDAEGTFNSDEEAIAYVEKLAASGDQEAVKALVIHRRNQPTIGAGRAAMIVAYQRQHGVHPRPRQ